MKKIFQIKIQQSLCILLTAVTLTACGGGSGDPATGASNQIASSPASSQASSTSAQPSAPRSSSVKAVDSSSSLATSKASSSAKSLASNNSSSLSTSTISSISATNTSNSAGVNSSSSAMVNSSSSSVLISSSSASSSSKINSSSLSSSSTSSTNTSSSSTLSSSSSAISSSSKQSSNSSASSSLKSSSSSVSSASSKAASSSSSSSSPHSSSVSSSSTSSSSNKSSSSKASSSKAAQVLLFENFDNATLPTSLGIWGGNEQLIASPTESYGNSGKSLKYIYSPMPLPNGAQYPGGSFNLAPYNTDHVYIRFRAKMPKYTHGIKFIKVFGQNSNGYANTTFGLDYTGIESGTGSMYVVAYGDGAVTENDTASILYFGGGEQNAAGRAKNLPGFSVSTPQYKNFAASDWGTSWHKFEFYVKFNSGTTAQNEKNDGETIVRIDDKVYMDAKGLFNRHYSNKPIDRLEILGWSQNTWPEIFENGIWKRKEQATPEFEIWYDNIEISINGWGDNSI